MTVNVGASSGCSRTTDQPFSSLVKRMRSTRPMAMSRSPVLLSGIVWIVRQNADEVTNVSVFPPKHSNPAGAGFECRTSCDQSRCPRRWRRPSTPVQALRPRYGFPHQRQS